MYSEKTLYNYIDNGFFDARNIDLPRKVRYRPRRKKGGPRLLHRAIINSNMQYIIDIMEYMMYNLIIKAEEGGIW